MMLKAYLQNYKHTDSKWDIVNCQIMKSFEWEAYMIL